jgi:hypothetical protein
MKRPLALAATPLFILASAACATQATQTSGELAASESSALTAGILGPTVGANDSLVSVFYGHPASLGQLTITLTGPTGTYSAVETAFGGAAPSLSHGTFFTGLAPCAPFTWAIVSGNTTYATGAIHTRATGNTACPSSEALDMSSSIKFHGVGHEFDGSDNLKYGNYPFGAGWTYDELHTPTGFIVGWQHYDNPGKEWLVDAYRAQITWKLDDTQMRRVTDATVVSPYGMRAGPASCVYQNIRESSEVAVADWPLTTTQTMNLSPWGNQTWSDALGGPEFGRGLQPRVAYGRPISFANGTASVDLGKPTVSTLVAGFIGTGDGFPAQVGTVTDTMYAQNNDACMIGLTAPKLQLSYAPLPPNTPLGCSVAIDCNDATISCNAGGDVFEVHQVTSAGDVAVATVDMTASPSTAFTKTVSQSGGASYYVCTVSGGQRACTSIFAPTSTIACCTSSSQCMGTNSPSLMTVTCPTAMSFYQVDQNTGATTTMPSGTSFSCGTEPSTASLTIVACPSGESPGGAGCQSFSEYQPKSGWCATPSPSPKPKPSPCGPKPAASDCDGVWHCCGSDGWTCGTCF